MLRRAPFLVCLAAALLVAACASTPPPSAPSGDLVLHLIGINDFHGNLDAPRGGAAVADPADPAKTRQVAAGGAARLATVVKDLRSRDPANTIMVGAGDLVGASPLLSSLFHDEPTVEALSQMGLALTAVGNHEFDEGPAELKRLQDGGCHPVDGCKGPAPFTGAKYRYLAASTVDDATGKTIFPAYAVREFEGIKVGFIGLTLRSTPDYVVPSGTAGLTFKDEAETINALVPTLRGQGVEAIVVLIHEGGYPAAGAGDCPALSGAITEIVPKLDKAVDLIVSGHTHKAYVCTIDGRLVTSAGLYGTMATDITVRLNRRTHDVDAAQARNIVVGPELAEDADVKALVERYRTLAAPLMNRVVGKIATTLTAAPPAGGAANGESQLGEIVADAMRAAAARTLGEPIDIAFMNAPGLRGALAFKGDGSVSYADIFAVQPFNNTLIAMTLTGADVLKVLDQQFDGVGDNAVLQVSDGFSYAWRKTGAGGAQVVAGSVTVNGKPLDPAARYRIVTNNYLAEGGDFFTAFKAGTDEKIAGSDSAALEAWLADRSPLGPPPLNRVRLAP